MSSGGDTLDLDDYSDTAKLKSYMAAYSNPDDPSIKTRYFTLYSLLPDLKDKVLLDLPCGLGHKARKFVLKDGAKKIYAVDVVEKQVELSKEEDLAAGIKPGQIEYAVHDAREAKVFADPLADICICIHLLCFAQDYPALVEMCRCIYLNLKPGGACYSLRCTLNQDDQLAKQFEEFSAEIFHVDSWQGDINKPRRFHYAQGGFTYDVFTWECDAVCKALREAGFSKVEIHPYQVDPSYNGKVDMSRYISVVHGEIIVATK